VEKTTATAIVEAAKDNAMLENLLIFVLQTFISEETGQSALKAVEELRQLDADKVEPDVVVS